MRAAHALGAELFDEHSHAFSRKDFTLPQLFACLVLREHQKKSYRGTEALLRDCADLRDAVGLARAPDHNTLCRHIAARTNPPTLLVVKTTQGAMALGAPPGAITPPSGTSSM